MIHWAKAKGTRVKEKIRFHEKSVRNVTLCHETQRWRCDINIMPELDGEKSHAGGRAFFIPYVGQMAIRPEGGQKGGRGARRNKRDQVTGD